MSHPSPARSLLIALTCVVLGLWCLSLVNCGSPTAPSSTYRLTFAKAPGCEPGTIPSEPTSDFLVAIKTGSDRLTVGWEGGLTVEFRQFGGTYLVCRVVNG